MYSSLFILVFWCVLFSLFNLKINQISCSEDKSRISNYKGIKSYLSYFLSNDSFNQMIILKNEMNSFQNSVQEKEDLFKKSSFISASKDTHRKLNQTSSFNQLINHSDNIKIKHPANNLTRSNEIKLTIKPSYSKTEINLENVFDQVFKSNYVHFCSCPPKLRNAYHSLQDLTYDNEEMDCIYLPMTTVVYQCKNQFKNDQFFVNKLICNLNSNTNRLEWIADVKDQLIDLDERLVREDQFTADQKTGWNETIEIKSQSTHLTDFNIQFLQCEQSNDEKLKLKMNKFKGQKSSASSLIESSIINSSNSQFNPISNRTKRSYSLERNVEVLIVIDILMNKYHGDNLENYIYTLMSTVSSIYKDSSIGNHINIAIVELILLNEKETKQLVSSSASNTLERFCRWQAELNINRTDEHPFYHDMAVLLTRTNLCRSNEHCDTLGLAHSSKICDAKLSCAIVEDNGLATALTIAHEIGHVLGIPHDQDEKCSQFSRDYQMTNQQQEQFNIMGKHLDFNYPWKWSDCSAHFITDFLDSGKGDCLLDRPKRNFLQAINMNDVTEEMISLNYEKLLKTKSTSDRRLLNMIRNNRIERERRDQRSNLVHNRSGRNKNLFLHELAFKKQNLLPGQYFNRDLQCQLIFGPESKICPYMSPCKRLWCTSGSILNSHLENEIKMNYNHNAQFNRKQETLSNRADEGCKTLHVPWSEGTECDPYLRNYSTDEHWCIKGECVSKQAYLENNLVVNGGWSEWSNWTECSRTCGGGIKSSFRLCNNPEPKNGGQYCLGQRKLYESCNIHECANSIVDFRQEQCSQFNNLKIKGIKDLPENVSSWIPHYAGLTREDSCKLYCRIESTGDYFMLKNKVIDGTDCLEKNKCVNGICVDAGCDNVINSRKELDSCAVCGGDNSTCTLIEGKFNLSKVNYGYNYIVNLPVGAVNIVIKQLNATIDDDNSLALRSSNGSYLINGGKIISNYERIMYFENVKIEYSGTGVPRDNESAIDQNTSVEEELLRLSSYEQRLTQEYNSQLNKLRHKKVSYTTDFLNRLYEHQHKIKEYRQQIQNLTKQRKPISSSSKQSKAEQFIETIVIKQTLKTPLVVEVLSVGELIKPEIVYRYSISNIDKESFKQSVKYNPKLIYGDKKLIDNNFDQLKIDQQNLKSNDQLILNKLKNNVKSTDQIKNKSSKGEELENVQAVKQMHKKYTIKIGKNLHIKQGTEQIIIRCPASRSMKSTLNTKWFKNEEQILFAKNLKKSDEESAYRTRSKSSKNFGEKNEIKNEIKNEDNRSKATSLIRYSLGRRGALIIRNIQQTDTGFYSCPFFDGYSKLVVI